MSERQALCAEVAALIDRLSDGGRDDAARDDLLGRVLRYQAEHVEAYRKLVRACPPGPLPAVPTDVFRFARVAAHPAELDVRVFRTSGTTQGPAASEAPSAARGAHHLRDLSLYDRAARAAARFALFPDVARMQLCLLAPAASELPESSLSYMLGRFVEWFAHGDAVYALRDGRLHAEALRAALRQAEDGGQPLALLGTSFAFVHAEDALGAERFSLPAGSRIMQTGGFKGRSREVAPDAMRQLLARRYGVPEPFIVSEYGMTELSSQLYETSLRQAALGLASTGPRRLWVPGWVRATPVDPETLRAVDGDQVGILRIDDLANVDTACAIQTSDLARCVGDGVVVLGRAADATPRGCSLAIDAVLGG